MPGESQAKREIEGIADLIRDAGGRVVGRTRLQKLAYLCELAGLGHGSYFEYRHYGPYSESLAGSTRKAVLLGLIQETEHPASWGGVYSVFTAQDKPRDDVLPARVELARIVAEADPVELELAATAAFLVAECDDPWKETAKRKPDKAGGGRLLKARRLYRKLAQIRTPRPLPDIG